MRKSKLCLSGLLGIALGASTVGAAELTLDLAVSSPQNAGNGAIFFTTQQQPTGTGVIDPFVRIQGNSTEEGYNTDGTSEFQTKDSAIHNWTHSIKLSDIPIVTLSDGIQYREFLLDINEAASVTKKFLSLNELQLFVSDRSTLSNFNTATETFGSPGSADTRQVYDLDAPTDQLVRMDYTLGSGSGSGDMFVYIRNSFFTTGAAQIGEADPFVYLYSKFGTPDGSDAGFEEWAVLQGRGTTTAIPLPASVWGGGLLLAAAGASRIIRRRKA